MKFTSLFKKTVVLTAVFVAAAIGVCNAAEYNLLDEDMKDVCKNSELTTNWWGRPGDLYDDYAKGKAWATQYGSGDGATDTEYGLGLSLNTVNSDGSTPGAANEIYFLHKVKEEVTLPENPSYKVTIDFRMGDKPKVANSDVWFTLRDSVGPELLVFRLYTQVGMDPEMGFASSTEYPFTPKTFDKTRNGMKIEYNKDYRIVITLSPYDNSYRFVAYLYDGDGNELDVGIIERYDNINGLSHRNPTVVTFMTKAHGVISVPEIFVHLKHIKLEASASEKPSATFTPADGAANVKVDDEFSVFFDKEVEPIAKENVSISNDASVEDVIMSEDGKKASFVFSGLKYGKTYNVKITDVKVKGESEGYDFDWSFTTANNISVSKFDFAKEEAVPVNIRFAALSDNDITDDAADEDYLNGKKFLTSSLESFNKAVNMKDDALAFKASGGRSQFELKKNIKIPYKENAEISAELKFYAKKVRWDDFAKANISLCADDNKIIDLIEYEITEDRKWARVSAVQPKGEGGFAGSSATVTGDYTLNLVFSPNGEMYDIKMILTDSNGNTTEKILEGALSKDDVSAINRIAVDYSVLSNSGDLGEVFALKSLNISSGDSAGLKDGDNVFYADYENLTPGEEFSADILVLVEDKTSGIVNSVDRTAVTGLSDTGRLEAHANITDAQNQRVRILLLNNINDMILLSESSLIGNQ